MDANLKPVWSLRICLRKHEMTTTFSTPNIHRPALPRCSNPNSADPGPPHLSLADPFYAAISCSRGASHRRCRRPKPKPIAFPPPPLRRLLPSPRGGGWFGRRRKIPAEEALTLALSLALGGDRLVGLAEAWKMSGLGQALGIWAAVWRRGRKRGGLRRLAAFLIRVAFCALVCLLRGVAFLEGLVRILLH